MSNENEYLDPAIGLKRSGGPDGPILPNSPCLQSSKDAAQVVMKELLLRIQSLEQRVSRLET